MLYTEANVHDITTEMLEVGVDRLPEERARRVLERVDLLNRLRNDIIPHPDLPAALNLALPSRDMPDWWIPGKHDHDLLKGVGRLVSKAQL